MKRILLICIISILVYACDKETDPAYDTHLFQQLQAHSWIFDSAKITDSTNQLTLVYPADTSINEITQFNSQEYLINNVRKSDSKVLDTASFQIIYDNPSRMYFYDYVTQQIIKKQYTDRKQYIDIDTVNAAILRTIKTDTLLTITRSYYHAQ